MPTLPLLTREEVRARFSAPSRSFYRRAAQEMVDRHLFVSLDVGSLKLPCTDPGATASAGSLRVVAVVGAGASAPALHRGQGLVQALKDSRVFDLQRHRDRVDELTFGVGIPVDDFEAQLAAMTLDPHEDREVRQQIRRLYDVRHPTLVCYELLAHLLKHRFIDGLIDFNWDGLLGQSVSDEMGENEFRLVISPRDCTPLPPMPGTPDYVPLVIKPHGAATDPDTLRFTQRAYYWMPEPVADCIKGLVGGQKCLLLLVGFGLTSEDFKRALLAPSDLQILDFSAVPVANEVIEELKKRRELRAKETTYEHIGPTLETTSGEPPYAIPAEHAADLACRLLTLEILEIARTRNGKLDKNNEYQQPWIDARSELRHLLVAALMGVGSPSSGQGYAEYLRDRTILEMALAGVKGRGLLSIKSLVEDRAGVYYEAYLQAATQAKLGTPERWSALCELAGLTPGQNGKETFTVARAVADLKAPTNVRSWTLGGMYEEDLGNYDFKLLMEQIWNALMPQTRSRAALALRAEKRDLGADLAKPQSDNDARSAGPPDRLRELFLETLGELSTTTEVEIRSRDDRICSRVFDRPQKLTTHSALRSMTRAMLHRAQQAQGKPLLAIVAETGEWLLNPEFSGLLANPALQLDLVVAFDKKIPALRERFGDRLNVSTLPWYRHNRHMTIVSIGGVPSEGIYYARRLRSAFINPVHVEGQSDAHLLMEAFIMYATEAEIRRFGEHVWKNLADSRSLLPNAEAAPVRTYQDLGRFRTTIEEAMKRKSQPQPTPLPTERAHPTNAE